MPPRKSPNLATDARIEELKRKIKQMSQEHSEKEKALRADLRKAMLISTERQKSVVSLLGESMRTARETAEFEERIAELRAQVADRCELQKRVGSLTRVLGEERTASAEKDAKMAAMGREKATLLKTIDSLRAMLVTSEAERKEAVTSRDRLFDEFVESEMECEALLTRRVAGLEDENERLAAELREAKQAVAAMRASVADVAEWRPMKAALEAEIATLRQKTSDSLASAEQMKADLAEMLNVIVQKQVSPYAVGYFIEAARRRDVDSMTIIRALEHENQELKASARRRLHFELQHQLELGELKRAAEVTDSETHLMRIDVGHFRPWIRESEETLDRQRRLIVALRKSLSLCSAGQPWHTCGICEFAFCTQMGDASRVPRVLHCGHTVCHGCIVAIDKRDGLNGAIRCPSCRVAYKCSDIRSLPINYVLFQS